jgi:hypothetical protein
MSRSSSCRRSRGICRGRFIRKSRRPGEGRDPYSAASIVKKASGTSALTDRPRRMGPPMRNCASEIALRLAGTTWIWFRDLATHCVRGSERTSRPPIERAQGRPGARCTRGLVCKLCIKMRTRAYRFSENTPAFPAQWLYGLLRALPGERRLCCHRRPSEALASSELDASIRASGPHDFAVRIRAVRYRPSASTASHHTFVAIMIRPSCRVRRADS